MSVLRRLPREDWERKLRAYRCTPLKGLTLLNSGEWWRAEWDVYPFVVPVEEDGYLDQIALERLIAGLVQTAPWGVVFTRPEPRLPLGDGDGEDQTS